MEQETLFDQYIDKTLSEEDRKSFERRLLEDVVFQKAFTSFKVERVAVESFFLKEELSNVEIEDANPTRKRLKTITTILSLLLIILALIWFIKSGSSTNHEFQIAQHYVPHPGLPVTMSSENEKEFLDGMIDYKANKFEVAIKKWKLLETQSDTLNYFIASALVQQNLFEEALPYLLEVRDQKSVFSSHSEWIYALCKFALGDQSYVLTIGASPDHPYHIQAKRLIAK